MQSNHLASYGIFLIGCGYFIQSLSTVWATPLLSHPEVSYNAYPFVSFSGSGINSTVTTIPNDQDFVITTAISGSNCDLYENSTLKVKGESEAMSVSNDFALAIGNGNLVISSGSTLSFSGNCSYFIEGYYTTPNGPRRTFSGDISGSGSHALENLSSDFVITTAIADTTSAGACNIYAGGSMLIDGSMGIMHFVNNNSSLLKGRAHIKANAGQSLSISNNGGYCQYYIEGYYLQ